MGRIGGEGSAAFCDPVCFLDVVMGSQRQLGAWESRWWWFGRLSGGGSGRFWGCAGTAEGHPLAPAGPGVHNTCAGEVPGRRCGPISASTTFTEAETQASMSSLFLLHFYEGGGGEGGVNNRWFCGREFCLNSARQLILSVCFDGPLVLRAHLSASAGLGPVQGPPPLQGATVCKTCQLQASGCAGD